MLRLWAQKAWGAVEVLGAMETPLLLRAGPWVEAVAQQAAVSPLAWAQEPLAQLALACAHRLREGLELMCC